MGEQRKYNALRNVPWQVRADIQKRIEDMEDGNEKTILTLYFLEDMSPRQIITHCQENGIYSRNHTFYTTRSIQNICNKHFPEARKYRKPNPQKKSRKGHFQFTMTHEKKSCALCGYEPKDKSELTWHHSIPANSNFQLNGERVHGDAVPENMVCYCKACHRSVTNYHIKKGYITPGLNWREQT